MNFHKIKKSNKKALITGVFGQDGSYLCEILTSLGYEVFGVVKKTLSENSIKIQQYLANKNIVPILYRVDLTDYESLKNLLLTITPDEVYHVAARHLSSQSMNTDYILMEKNIFDYNSLITSNILAICYEYLRTTKVIIAGSSLMFDGSESNIQNESTPFRSNSLYGLAKIAENSLVKYYRQNGLFCAMAILFNHESSRRNDSFVTKKIVKNMVAVRKGILSKFTLGNLSSKKDWGYAKDYAYGMYLMAQSNKAEDYILSSFQLHTIKDFVEICADILQLPHWKNYITIDDSIVGRKINCTLLGNNSKAVLELNWHHTLSFYELIELMISNEINSELI
jgi:GDPmannose 4,6-dehydratase